MKNIQEIHGNWRSFWALLVLDGFRNAKAVWNHGCWHRYGLVELLISHCVPANTSTINIYIYIYASGYPNGLIYVHLCSFLMYFSVAKSSPSFSYLKHFLIYLRDLKLHQPCTEWLLARPSYSYLKTSQNNLVQLSRANHVQIVNNAPAGS